ncbi:MAG: hypothetical protein WD356_06150, partial [Pseudomonadales bacterium]
DDAFFNWQRPGAAQFRHPHAFLGLMCNILHDHYAELVEAFYGAGARAVTFQQMLPPDLKDKYAYEAGDERLWLLTCRRATMEAVLRRYVETRTDVSVINPCTVTGIISEKANDNIVVRGVTFEFKGESRQRLADVVVDASGRTSRFPKWLGQSGGDVVEEKHDAKITYYTRHYRLKPGATEPPRGNRSGAGDLGYLRFGVFPGDNGHFAIIICLPFEEKALRTAVRDGNKFDRICRSIPALQSWLDDERSEATTEPFGIGDIVSVWRDFVRDGRPVAHNFYAVGDSAVRTNPLYGRGCSTGMLHARLLVQILDTIDDPKRRALALHEQTRAKLRPIFDLSVREDMGGIKRAEAIRQGKALHEPDSMRERLRLAFRDALGAASRENLHVARGAMRSFNLLEKPGEFLNDWSVRWTVLRYMLRGRTTNARRRMQPGPDRDEMHRLLETGPLDREARAPVS